MDIVALELIKALQQIDKVNSYFIFVQKGEDSSCISTTDNFTIVEVPGATYADWEQIFLPIYAAKYRVELLHCTSNTAPLFCTAPTIITLHDIIFLEKKQQGGHLFSFYQQLGRIYRKYIVPASARQTKHIITVSHYEKERIAHGLQINADKVSVVYNSFGKHFELPDRSVIENICAKYNLPKNYIFYIGNTDPKKNMFNTFQAYASYLESTADPLPLVVADVNEKNLEIMLEKANLQSYAKYFILTGYVHNADLPFIYAGAEIFLYPSLRESFGIPVLESMACGTPVITSNTSALPEVAGNAAILVNPDSQHEITSAIKSFLTNDTLRSDMIAKGLKRINDFSWGQSADQLLKIYQTI